MAVTCLQQSCVWFYKLKGVERTCLTTDALAYAANEGKPVDDPRIIIEDGVCKLADHSSLVGSIATMDVLVRTIAKMPEFLWQTLFAWLLKRRLPDGE